MNFLTTHYTHLTILIINKYYFFKHIDIPRCPIPNPFSTQGAVAIYRIDIEKLRNRETLIAQIYLQM